MRRTEYRGSGILFRLKAAHLQRGLWHALLRKPVQVLYRICRNYSIQVYLNLLPARTFRFHGRVYRYVFHRYNTTWHNERAVEIPIAAAFIEEARGRRVLEVGNVLSHYLRCTHDVVDKYEAAPRLIREDAGSFQPAKPYDLIVSVSTLEHVGWDEPERSPEKVLRAVANLAEYCLAPGGLMVVTLPLGYNSALDRFLEEGLLRFDEVYFLKRTSQTNTWEEVRAGQAYGAKYGEPYPYANVVLVGILGKV